MKETSPRFEAIVAERHRRMTPEQRLRAAAAMFEAARTIVDASRPTALSRTQRRLAIARRLYGDSLPDAALIAHADWIERREYPLQPAMRGGADGSGALTG